ncbi:HEPN domain-containing protein [Bacteroides caecimuris]|uniref:DNA-binding protein n=1 Tax=Bacteroides caecimuris TaxID=1796613 RepID=A0A1C7GX41_9BACE|nr:HEPN domain-containing protein [Bacteroides caecimuris]ANU56893.1 DNA-binding protein [Bacteroides caecimuris]NDO59024.1 HEPN domain-containing protein [Bacteroides caecimuris]OXE66719.1 DNA-binding protein [Bacteroides caecimuris]QQR18252.1 HEPN domain-containing protein [Bacteroides caecimuris]TGY31483.1 HEPN domain-containing protein [Bacteroides caecimuris]
MNEDVRQNIVMYRMGKARQLLHDVDVLIENELWNSTINRMYYACFHAVSALLIKNGIEVKSHMGIRQAFGLHFVKAGKVSLEYGRIFSRIYDKRQSSDYDDFIDFTKEEVEKLYPQIKSFIMVIGNLVED